MLVQTKWINKGSGEPEAKEIASFMAGVKDLIEQESANFNPALQGKFADISKRLANPGTSVRVVVATTGASQLSQHTWQHIERLLSELNGDQPPIAAAETMGLSEMYSGLAGDTTQAQVVLEAQLLEWSYVASPYAAYYGMIDGLSLKGWLLGGHGKRIFAANIRNALGSTEVNNEIKNSAATAPEKFWYFNNGITLISDSVLKAPLANASRSAGNFTFRGASIVNGAQTVSSLAKVDDTSLGKVRVPIRVILLEKAPEGFGDEVTRTNNLQNRVEVRDFAAQDPEQRRLRVEMAMENVDYEFVRGDEVVSGPGACELIEVTTALVCALGDAALATQLKTSIGRFFVDLTKAPYKAVFNPTVNGAKAFNAVLLLRQVEKWIEAKRSKLQKRSGTPWGALVHGNRILASAVFSRIGPSELAPPIDAFRQHLSTLNVDAACEIAYNEMVATIDKGYKGKFLAVLFKNPTMSRAVFDAARK